jgi:hypothetical protein
MAKEKKKTTPQPPKVSFNGKVWVLLRRAGTTVTLTDNFEEINVLASNVTPTNNAARAILK